MTGKATSVGPIGVADVIGSGFVDDPLYGFTGSSQIRRSIPPLIGLVCHRGRQMACLNPRHA
jgi:hypothetical protein